MKQLILPGNPLFDLTLAVSLPPNWKDVSDGEGVQCAFVMRSHSGLMDAVDERQLSDYLHGGEYDERLLTLDS